MNYKKRIIKILREEAEDAITVTSTSDDLQDTISTVKDATSQDSSLKGKVKVDVTTEGMDDLQVPDDAEAYEGEYEEKEELKKQAAKAVANEETYPTGSDRKFGDTLKGYYNKTVKRNADGIVGNVVRWDDGKLKVVVTQGEHQGKTFTAEPSEVVIIEQAVGRMTKGKLEKLVEQNKKVGAAYKKIIKVSELRNKKHG
jgi:hypothetical protein